ncbi:MAG TPA: hypothetical protein VKU80_01410 [Planctomycetota bacterium]|nr:hypothetical protein [Planctomycetota bacterium]
MSEVGQVALFAGGVVGVLFLLGLLTYSRRARNWTQKAEANGEAVCKDCGHKGPLSYGFLTGARVTSANIRLVCAECEGENWCVPGGKRDPNRRGTKFGSAHG